MATVALVKGELSFIQLIDVIIDRTDKSDDTEVHVEFDDCGKQIKLVGQKLLASNEFINVDNDDIVSGLKIKDLLDGTDGVKNLILQSKDEKKYRRWYLS